MTKHSRLLVSSWAPSVILHLSLVILSLSLVILSLSKDDIADAGSLA
jgi:hypothetical protein